MKLALLHYSIPPVVGGVESVLAQHARLMADAGHDVRVIAGRGGQFDPRIAFISMPLADSHRAEVLDVKSELDAGRVPPVFAALVDMLRAELARALAGVDVLIAHNVCSLNKNLALTAALHDLHAQAGAPRMILWHHDLAWTTPRYRPELHEGWPWDLLRADWPAATQVVVSTLRQQELAELLRNTSLCGLGQAAPNPVLGALENFTNIYDKLVEERKPGLLPTFDLTEAVVDAELRVGRHSEYV